MVALASAAEASADVSLSVAPQFPASATIGDHDVAASLTIQNTSTGGEATGPVTLSQILLLPYCVVQTRDAVTCYGSGGESGADPGVISVAPTATGAAGTGCAGVAFDVAVFDAGSGEVAFTPPNPIALAPPGGPDASCTIDFAINILREPLSLSLGSGLDEGRTFPGVRAVAHAAMPSDSGVGSGVGMEMTIERLTPVITASAQPTGLAPTDLDNSAEIHGPGSAAAPTGTLHWSLYGPNDDACTGSAGSYNASATVTGDGPYHATLHEYDPGTYRWVLSYSGDATYKPFASRCGDPGETSVVAGPRFEGIGAGANEFSGDIVDAVFLDVNATGTVAFALYGPDDPGCAAAPIFTSTVAVPGRFAPMVQSDFFKPADPGTYHWVAVYSGDALNASRTVTCADPKSAVVVPVAPRLRFGGMTVIVAPGATQSAVATLSGLVHPTGTLTFSLYGPWNTSCVATPVLTTTTPVNGNGTYTSEPAVAALSGVYVWVAHYNGDATSGPLTTGCDPSRDGFDAIRTSDFAITSTTVARDHSITMAIADHSIGSLTGVATFVETRRRTTGRGKHRHTVTRHKTVMFGKATVGVGGTLGALTFKPSAAARVALRHVHHLAVTAALQFTGRDAAPKRHRASITVHR